jgi:hypothetical protein
MGKKAVPFIAVKRGQPRKVKNMSHGTFRARRHPNSKRVTNGSEK